MPEFADGFFAKKKEESSDSDDSLMSKIRKSPMTKAAMLAAGLHAAPFAVREVKEGVAYAAEVKKHWKEDAVLRPQTDQERDLVARRIQEREKHRDLEGLKTYQVQVAERLERGEDVSFKELYFHEAELNGVPHERVVRAERLAEEMINHFSTQVGNELSDEEIREIARKMFDQAHYDWGQGSVVDYFIDHVRNCDSISKPIQIVLEGVINRLPVEQRGRYHLGRRYEHQHVIATLGVSPQRDEDVNRLFILQPSFDVEKAGITPAGTATVDSRMIKQALAGKKVKIYAQTPSANEALVDSGPMIDAIVNQDVPDGIEIEGKLRSASANRNQAEREHISPISRAEYDKKYTVVMDLELRNLDQSKQAMIRDLQEARSSRPTQYPLVVDYRHVTKPDADIFLNNADWDPDQVGISKMVFGDLTGWSPDAMRRLTSFNVHEISVSAGEDGRFPEAFVNSIKEHVEAERAYAHSPNFKGGFSTDHMSLDTLELRQSEKPGSKALSADQLERILFWMEKFRDLKYTGGLDGKDNAVGLKLDVENLTDDMLNVLKKHPPVTLYLSKRLLSFWEFPSNSSTFNPARDKVLKELKSLHIPVFVDIANFDLGNGEPVPTFAYDWLFDDKDFIFPSFESLQENDSTSPSNMFYLAMDMRSLNEDPKPFLIHRFYKDMENKGGRNLDAKEKQDASDVYELLSRGQKVFSGITEFSDPKDYQTLAGLSKADVRAFGVTIDAKFNGL